jgi:hypothetical protein
VHLTNLDVSSLGDAVITGTLDGAAATPGNCLEVRAWDSSGTDITGNVYGDGRIEDLRNPWQMEVDPKTGFSLIQIAVGAYNEQCS